MHGIVQVQFDDMTLSTRTIVPPIEQNDYHHLLGYGWHLFRQSDFHIEFRS
jgi:hypothetical protein